MKIFDSNIWIAYFHEEDNQHEKAREIFLETKYPIAITEYIIIETCNVLLAKTQKENANSFIDFALDNEDVVLLLSNGGLFFETISRFRQKTNRKLSFVDLSLACLGKDHKIVTFDRKLNNELNRESASTKPTRKRKKIPAGKV
jgi:predicted nucleic acid-binding protein